MANHNRHDQRYIQSFVGYAPPAPVPASSAPSQYVYGQGGGYRPSAPAPASSSSSQYGHGQGGGYRPSAPAPVSSSTSQYGHGQGGGYRPSAPAHVSSSTSQYGHGQGGGYPPPTAPVSSSTSQYGHGQGQGQGQGGYPPSSAYPTPIGGFVAFPPGTHPDVVRAFRAVDRDRSGSIDELELQAALSTAYHKFSIRTIRLLMFLFSSNRASSPSRMRPAEFVPLWNCLGQWRGIFDRYDRDRSGKIDSNELNEALRCGLGYAVPHSVIEALIANYNNGVSRRGALDFDNFVECGMVVKGLTEKFKEKDAGYTGSATLKYDSFLSIVIPLIVP